PEHRLAAKREEALLALRIDAAELEIAERPPRLKRRAMRGPARRIGMDRGHVPARPAEHRLARRAVRLGVRGARDTVLGGGRPIEVGRQLDQAAKTRLAFARHAFGLLAAQELAELAADDAYRLQQPRIGLARLRARERDDADRDAFAGHRTEERAARPFL